jgi:hypothetical protein
MALQDPDNPPSPFAPPPRPCSPAARYRDSDPAAAAPSVGVPSGDAPRAPPAAPRAADAGSLLLSPEEPAATTQLPPPVVRLPEMVGTPSATPSEPLVVERKWEEVGGRRRQRLEKGTA